MKIKMLIFLAGFSLLFVFSYAQESADIESIEGNLRFSMKMLKDNQRKILDLKNKVDLESKGVIKDLFPDIEENQKLIFEITKDFQSKYKIIISPDTSPISNSRGNTNEIDRQFKCDCNKCDDYEQSINSLVSSQNSLISAQESLVSISVQNKKTDNNVPVSLSRLIIKNQNKNLKRVETGLKKIIVPPDTVVINCCYICSKQ